jgi:hypothetical protein
LVFKPGHGESGISYATINFTVTDSADTTSADEYTLTFDVTEAEKINYEQAIVADAMKEENTVATEDEKRQEGENKDKQCQNKYWSDCNSPCTYSYSYWSWGCQETDS